MMTAFVPPAAFQAGKRLTSLVLATLAQAGMTFAHQGVVVIGIFFVAAYHLTLSQMGIVVSCVSLGWMCSSFFTGMLVDRWGPRSVLFCGVLLMSAAAIVSSRTTNLLAMCALLFVIGLGVSTVSLAGTVTVLTSWSQAERGLPMGIRQMGVPVGSLVAALTLPTIAARLGIHALFLLFAAELFTLGMAFCWVLPPTARVASPALPTAEAAPGLWRDLRHIALPCFAGFLLAWSQYTLLTFTIPMLHSSGGLSVALAGVALAMAQLGGGIARIGLGKLSDRLQGRHDLVLVGTAASAAILALLVGVMPMRLPLAVILGLWLVLGAAMVGWNALIVTWSGERVRARNAGAAMGLTTSCVLLGAIITAPLLGALIQVTGTYASAWLALAAILAVATVVLWRGVRRAEVRTATVAEVPLVMD